MSRSAPSDLSAAFRSFARRHRETTQAAIEVDRTADAAPHLAALSATVAAAAAALGIDAPNDLAEVGSAIADTIDATDAEEWSDDRLERLRGLASESGQHLRRAGDAIEG
jgi:hypothetical protein